MCIPQTFYAGESPSWTMTTSAPGSSQNRTARLCARGEPARRGWMTVSVGSIVLIKCSSKNATQEISSETCPEGCLA